MTRTPFLRCRTDSRRAIAILLVAILIPIFAMSPALAQTLTITHDGVDIGVIGATNLPSNETEAGSSGGTANPIIPNFGADWIDGGPPPNAATGLKNMLGPYLGVAYDVGAHERSLGVAWTGPRQFTDFLAYGLPQGWIVASEATLAQAKYTKLNAPALRDGRVVIVKQDDDVPAFIAVDFESQKNESTRWTRFHQLVKPAGETFLVPPMHFRDGLAASIVRRANVANFLGSRVDLEGLLRITGGVAASNLGRVQDDMFTFFRSLYYAWNLAEAGSSAKMTFATPPASGQDPDYAGPLVVDVTLTSAAINWNKPGSNSATMKFRRQGETQWRDALDLSRVNYRGIDSLSGSVFRLSPGTTYEVTVAGAGSTRFTTRSMPRIPSGGNVVAVSNATQLATAFDSARPGDTIRLHAGNYGTWKPRSGRGSTEAKPILVRPFGDGVVKFFQIRTGADYLWLDGFTVSNGNRKYDGAIRGEGTGITATRMTVDKASYGFNAENHKWLIMDNVIEGVQIPGNCSGRACYTGEGIQNDKHVRGIVAAFNEIFHTADAISYGHGNIDLHNNKIHHVSDDFIELDYVHDNARVWENIGFSIKSNAFSQQPINGGPWYYFLNQVVGVSNIFKLRGGAGDKFIVKNCLAAAHPTQKIERIFQGNGMLAGNYFAVKNDQGFGYNHIGYKSSALPNPIRLRLWDYNRYDTSDGNLYKLGKRYLLSELPTLGGDKNSRMVTTSAPGLQVHEGTSITLSGKHTGTTTKWEWLYQEETSAGVYGPETSLSSGKGASISNVKFEFLRGIFDRTYRFILRVNNEAAPVEQLLEVDVLKRPDTK